LPFDPIKGDLSGRRIALRVRAKDQTLTCQRDARSFVVMVASQRKETRGTLQQAFVVNEDTIPETKADNVKQINRHGLM
jgi:hypothetical protein